MTRLTYSIILGLLGAGIIHIAILLLVPAFSVRDAWTMLSTQSNYYVFTRLDPPGSEPHARSLDPLFNASACRFDLSDGPVHITGKGSVPYWSISIYDRPGQNIFSFNDRSTTDGGLDFVVATPAQMVGLRNALPEDYDRAVFVEAELREGIAAVRVFTPDISWEPTVNAYLQALRCVGGGR